MNKIYLVCTRAAMSGSALAYIINQSPDFYNTLHNNVWEEENNDSFGTAYTINDWWNLNDDIANKLQYDVIFRNTQQLTKTQLINLCKGFNDLSLDKNLCLFSHARNIKEIKNHINNYNLPIVIVSTVFGEKCGTFINSWIKREYSNEMNKFIDLFDSWEYIFTQRISNDEEWKKHSDYAFGMHDWLIDTNKIYDSLNIKPYNDIHQWTKQYLDKNNSNAARFKDTSQKLSTLLSLFDLLQSNYKQGHEKVLLCYNLFELIHTHKKHDLETLVDSYHKTY